MPPGRGWWTGRRTRRESSGLDLFRDVYHANAEVMYDKGPVYGISETPSFVLIDGGKLKEKHEGFLDADELVAFAHGSYSDDMGKRM